jgi:hypothetical protein
MEVAGANTPATFHKAGLDFKMYQHILKGKALPPVTK